MPIVQATTPTGAGFAQAFDTSGLVQIEAAQKEKRDKRLQELLVDYDTKGIFKRDIPYLQEKINETQQWVMDNHRKLVSPARHMNEWSEYQKKQSEIKNIITASIAAKEQAAKASTRLYGANGMYLTENNKNALDMYSQTPSREAYEDWSAFDDPMKGFDRNYDLNPEKYAKAIKYKSTGIEDTGEKIGGKIVTKESSEVDEEATRAALEAFWNGKGLEATSLHDVYKGDFEAFYQESLKMADEPEKFGITAPVKPKEAAESAADKKAKHAVVRRTGSGYHAVETVFGEQTVGKGKKATTVTAPVVQGMDDTGKEQYAIKTYGVMTVGGQDNTMTFYPGIKITKNLDQAYDMQKGQILAPGEGKDFNYQVPVERSTYVTATQPIELTYTEKDGKVIKHRYKQGEPLPDIVAMRNDGSISKDEFNRVSKLVNQQIGYIVAATNENINFEGLAEGEDPMHMLKKAGARFFMVPAEGLDVEVNQQLGYKYGTSLQDYGAEERPKYNLMGNL
jgi:hypothetical protein